MTLMKALLFQFSNRTLQQQYMQAQRGCRLIPILKAPTEAPTAKQAYPADHLAFQPGLFCQICLFFLSSSYFRAQKPLSRFSGFALSAKLSFEPSFL